MKNYLKFLILFFLSLFTTSSFAYTAPNPPPNGTYVLDLANKLSTDQINSLNNKIQGIKNSTENEFAVLILQNMEGNSIEDVRYTVFNSWGVGKKGLDNGVLIVIAVSERKTGIETGKGVGELTDLQSNDILANTLRPFLKKGDFYGGLNATIDAASSAIESRKNTKSLQSVSSNSSDTNSDGAGFILLLIFGGIALFAAVFYFIANIQAEKRRKEKEIQEAEDYKEQWERAKRQAEHDRAAAIERMKKTPSIKPSISTEYKIPTRNINGAVTIPKTVEKESFPTKKVVVGAAVVGAGILAAEEIARKKHEENERARKRREHEEEEERSVRIRREESSSSSSSSWPSSDSGSSWGGGGFDGGSSGGGGASSDW